MRYGILSDIHGNLEALEAVLELYQKEDIEKYLCAGDIVGYGANPKECLDIIRDLNAVCIAGNHDWAVSGKYNMVNFNQAAKDAVLWTQSQLSTDDMDFINQLGLIHINNDLILVHGTLNEPEEFHYLVYMSEAEENFHLMDRNICFMGHLHAPQLIVQKKQKAQCLITFRTIVNPANNYIVNVGSVGQPRDGNPTAAYCVYDTETGLVEIKRALYDIETAQQKILDAGLPAVLAQRLGLGQ